ncbi:MAG: hypothetical protein PWQ84_1314 [Thermotogaceae bacterium]|nr:hypothetical protein [Thermotogaceae bacterium]
MRRLKNGGFVLYEPEQDIEYHKSYKRRYEILLQGLKKDYLTKKEAIKRLEDSILNGDEKEKEKYLKKLKAI